MLWSIHGKTYDLTKIIDTHPGGRYILIKTRGMGDITALFESYPTFSNKHQILKQLEQYQMPADITETYDFTTYNELSDIIKEKFQIQEE